MTRYSMSTPRPALAIAAAAMTALTFAVLVVMPSQMEAGSRAYAQLAHPRLVPVSDCAREPGSGAAQSSIRTAVRPDNVRRAVPA